MRLDLREIINVPGTGVTFNYEPDLSPVFGGSVTGVTVVPRARGGVRNSAGVLLFTAEVETTLKCVCARCLKEFEFPVRLLIETTLLEGDEDVEDTESDAFYLVGDFVDVDEIITTEFLLELEPRLLCREDCKGLCPKCGADLNSGACTCKPNTDPRLAVLGQLLDNE